MQVPAASASLLTVVFVVISGSLLAATIVLIRALQELGPVRVANIETYLVKHEIMQPHFRDLTKWYTMYVSISSLLFLSLRTSMGAGTMMVWWVGKAVAVLLSSLTTPLSLAPFIMSRSSITFPLLKRIESKYGHGLDR